MNKLMALDVKENIAMIDYFFHDFMGRALLAGVGLGSISALVGCFLLWRRMAFFGDAMGHAAVLGVALGTLLNLNVYLFIILVCVLVAVTIGVARQRSVISVDTWLASISYTSLALGMIILSKSVSIQIEPESILFGDILGVDRIDILWIYIVALIVWGGAIGRWQKVLLLTLDEELAHTSGVSVTSMRLGFTLCVAIVTAVGLKTAGALLLPALMILPAASVSRYSQSPEIMVAAATVVSLLSVVIGIWGSFYYDIPSGPSIVMVAFGFFILSFLGKR